MAGVDKKTAYEKWSAHPNLTISFCNFMEAPGSISPDNIEIIEELVVLLYSKSCPYSDVNKARQYIFGQSSKPGFEYLPPTRPALTQHIKRTTYQAGYIWAKSLVPMQEINEQSSSWGWVEGDSSWTTYWTPLPRAVKAMQGEVMRCGCIVKCVGMCSCYSRGLICTALCKCGGTCYGRFEPPPLSRKTNEKTLNASVG